VDIEGGPSDITGGLIVLAALGFLCLAFQFRRPRVLFLWFLRWEFRPNS
jgi:hypothetical protein